MNPKDLEAKFAYIQVTHVTPYLEEKELEERRNDFERNHNIRRFVFETPFTECGKRHGGVDEQCKRRTVLTSESILGTDPEFSIQDLIGSKTNSSLDIIFSNEITHYCSVCEQETLQPVNV